MLSHSIRIGAAIASIGLLGATIQAEECPSRSDKWPFMIDQGNNTARVFFESALELNRDCRNLMARAYSGAGGGLFSLEAILFEADAEIKLRDRKAFDLKSGFVVLGQVVNSQQYQHLVEKDWKDKLIFPIDISKQDTIMVGPLPVKLTYGVEAEAGVDYVLSARFLELDLALNPFVEADVYARASMDVGFAAVRTSGTVNLIENKVKSQFLLTVDQVDLSHVDMIASSDNELHALDGYVNVDAGAELGSFQRSYSRELFRWDGYRRNDQLYDINERVVF